MREKIIRNFNETNPDFVELEFTFFVKCLNLISLRTNINLVRYRTHLSFQMFKPCLT